MREELAAKPLRVGNIPSCLNGGFRRDSVPARRAAASEPAVVKRLGGHAVSLLTSTHERAESEKLSDATPGHCEDSQHHSVQVALRAGHTTEGLGAHKT
jgi:hypothetical protein